MWPTGVRKGPGASGGRPHPCLSLHVSSLTEQANKQTTRDDEVTRRFLAGQGGRPALDALGAELCFPPSPTTAPTPTPTPKQSHVTCWFMCVSITVFLRRSSCFPGFPRVDLVAIARGWRAGEDVWVGTQVHTTQGEWGSLGPPGPPQRCLHFGQTPVRRGSKRQ